MTLTRKIFKLPPEYQPWADHYTGLGFKDGDLVLYLGEIENMPGHVAVVNRNGQVRWGFHPELFEDFDEENSG